MLGRPWWQACCVCLLCRCEGCFVTSRAAALQRWARRRRRQGLVCDCTCALHCAWKQVPHRSLVSLRDAETTEPIVSPFDPSVDVSAH